MKKIRNTPEGLKILGDFEGVEVEE